MSRSMKIILIGSLLANFGISYLLMEEHSAHQKLLTYTKELEQVNDALLYTNKLCQFLLKVTR